MSIVFNGKFNKQVFLLIIMLNTKNQIFSVDMPFQLNMKKIFDYL